MKTFDLFTVHYIYKRFTTLQEWHCMVVYGSNPQKSWTCIYKTCCNHNFILVWQFYTTGEPVLSNDATWSQMWSWKEAALCLFVMYIMTFLSIVRMGVCMMGTTLQFKLCQHHAKGKIPHGSGGIIQKSTSAAVSYTTREFLKSFNGCTLGVNMQTYPVNK